MRFNTTTNERSGTRGFTDNRIKRTLRQIAAFECNRGRRDCNYRDEHFVLSPFRASIDFRLFAVHLAICANNPDMVDRMYTLLSSRCAVRFSLVSAIIAADPRRHGCPI